MMTALQNKNFLRIIAAFIILMAMLLFINIRIKLEPNSVIVNANPSKFYESPEIFIDTGNGYESAAFSSGQILPFTLNDLTGFRIEFPQQPYFTGEEFIFFDHSIDEEMQTSKWVGFLNPFAIDPENVQSISFTPLDTEATYELYIDAVPYSLRNTEGVLSVDNLDLKSGQAGRIEIAKTILSPAVIADIRQIALDIDAVYVVLKEPEPIQITSIKMAKNFNRLGLVIPIKTLNAREIDEYFALDEQGIKKVVDYGYVGFTNDNADPIKISSNRGFINTLQKINFRTTYYMVALNLLAVLSVLLFFLLLGKLASQYQDKKPERWKMLIQFYGKLKDGVNGFLQNQEIQGLTIRKIIIIFLKVGFFISLALSFFIVYENRNILIFLFAFGCLSIIIENKLSQERISKVNHSNCSRKKWIEILVVIILVVINCAALFYNLGAEGFKEDEFQVIDSAAGYLYTGQFSRWDWIEEEIGNPYGRAWPHTFLIAQAFKVLGISEFSGRFVSAMGGVVFIICLYFFARFFTNRKIALFTLFSTSLFPAYLGLFRYARMYAMLLPMFLILTYCIYRGLTGDWHIRTGIKKLDDFVSKNLNYDYRFLLVSIPLLYLTYLIHVNSLVIVLAAYLFVCVLALKDKEKKYIILAILGLVIGAILISMMIILENSESIQYNYESLPKFSQFFSFFGRRNFVYLDYLVSYPFGKIGGLILVGFVCYIIVKYKKTEFVNKYLYLLIISIFSVIFFIYIADRYASYYYISHITSITLLLIISGFYYISKLFLKKPFILTLLLCTIVFSVFLGNFDSLYGGVTRFGDFDSAYQVIIENYEEENEVIFGQYLRAYYLKDLEDFTAISMMNNRQYTYEQFLEDLEDYESGWLTWESRKAYHVDNQIINYANENFYKIHGRDIDELGVEVYYFNSVTK